MGLANPPPPSSSRSVGETGRFRIAKNKCIMTPLQIKCVWYFMSLHLTRYTYIQLYNTYNAYIIQYDCKTVSHLLCQYLNSDLWLYIFNACTNLYIYDIDWYKYPFCTKNNCENRTLMKVWKYFLLNVIYLPILRVLVLIVPLFLHVGVSLVLRPPLRGRVPLLRLPRPYQRLGEHRHSDHALRWG